MSQIASAPSTNDLTTLAEDARALLAATAEVTGDKISDARKRLAAALDCGRKMVVQAKDKAVEGAKVADSAVHEHPYAAMGIAFGVGSILGYVLASALARNRN